MILHGLEDEMVTLGVIFQHRLILDVVCDILGRQQGEPHAGQELGAGGLPVLKIKVDPGYEGLEDQLLTRNIQIIGGEKLDELVSGEKEELLVLDHLEEVVLSELPRRVSELDAGLGVCEQSYSDAV